MKKLLNAKMVLAAVAAGVTLVSTGCDADINLNVNNSEGKNYSSSFSGEKETDKGSSEENHGTAADEISETAEDAEAGEQPAETAEAAADEVKNEENSTEEVSEEKKEEAPAEENNDSVIEIRSDGTAVVLEDGIRYGRMTHETGSVYLTHYSAEEIDMINEHLKRIQHDAVEKYGNWQRSSTEEQQGDGVSFVSFRGIFEDNAVYFDYIWAVNTGNPEGEVFYDAKTLEILTVEQFFGSDWAANNMGTSDDESLGSMKLVGNISCETDGDEVVIVFENKFRDVNIKLKRSSMNPDYAGSIKRGGR